jgi:hypothetical protein
MLPQVNYVATILTPNDDTIKRIEQITENFVAKGLNIGKKKLYKTVEQGGIGMFNLNEFIASLQCAWIKRSFVSVTDNWRYKLCEISNNSALLVTSDSLTRNSVGMVLNNIVASFCKFKEKFATLDNNYMTVPFYCNNSFGYGRGMEHKLDEHIFGTNNNLEIRNAIIGTTWSDITINGIIMSKPQIEMRLDIELSNRKYGNICNAYRCAFNKYNKIDAPSTHLATFVTSFKKGSKRFRTVGK